MKKYLLIATFDWTDDMMKMVPKHRELVDSLIDDQVIDHYTVSMEIQTVWITLNAKTKRDAKRYLASSPLYKHWIITVHELMVWDGQNYRLPALQLN